MEVINKTQRREHSGAPHHHPASTNISSTIGAIPFDIDLSPSFGSTGTMSLREEVSRRVHGAPTAPPKSFTPPLLLHNHVPDRAIMTCGKQSGDVGS